LRIQLVHEFAHRVSKRLGMDRLHTVRSQLGNLLKFQRIAFDDRHRPVLEHRLIRGRDLDDAALHLVIRNTGRGLA
jgi:hypothetical protein